MSELKDKIIELRNIGKTYTEIQAELKCSKGTISFHLSGEVKAKQYKRANKYRAKNVSFIKSQLGGKCCVCGYCRTVSALELHHKDPSIKEFDISSSRATLKKMVEESKKCVLLCANCHREVHDGLIKLGV